jgi:hypothetical protein
MSGSELATSLIGTRQGTRGTFRMKRTPFVLDNISFSDKERIKEQKRLDEISRQQKANVFIEAPRSSFQPYQSEEYIKQKEKERDDKAKRQQQFRDKISGVKNYKIKDWDSLSKREKGEFRYGWIPQKYGSASYNRNRTEAVAKQTYQQTLGNRAWLDREQFLEENPMSFKETLEMIPRATVEGLNYYPILGEVTKKLPVAGGILSATEAYADLSAEIIDPGWKKERDEEKKVDKEYREAKREGLGDSFIFSKNSKENALLKKYFDSDEQGRSIIRRQKPKKYGSKKKLFKKLAVDVIKFNI